MFGLKGTGYSTPKVNLGRVISLFRQKSLQLAISGYPLDYKMSMDSDLATATAPNNETSMLLEGYGCPTVRS